MSSAASTCAFLWPLKDAALGLEMMQINMKCCLRLLFCRPKKTGVENNKSYKSWEMQLTIETAIIWKFNRILWANRTLTNWLLEENWECMQRLIYIGERSLILIPLRGTVLMPYLDENMKLEVCDVKYYRKVTACVCLCGSVETRWWACVRFIKSSLPRACEASVSERLFFFLTFQ